VDLAQVPRVSLRPRQIDIKALDRPDQALGVFPLRFLGPNHDARGRKAHHCAINQGLIFRMLSKSPSDFGFNGFR
jgi:hypothetical protein